MTFRSFLTYFTSLKRKGVSLAYHVYHQTKMSLVIIAVMMMMGPYLATDFLDYSHNPSKFTSELGRTYN
jgi:hypothetical protein